jgi:HprK-related kinase A
MSPRTLADLGDTELRRRLAGDGLRFALSPFVVHVQSRLPIVAEGIGRLYAEREVVDPANSFADFHVSVNASWSGWHCSFELDGHRPFTPLAAGEGFAFLEWGLNWCVTAHCHHWLLVHSAVLARDDRAVLMPAPPGSGKSTLCAALMDHGWRLLSDEMALIDPASGLLTPSPRAISLKNQSIALIAGRCADAVMGPMAHDTQKGTVAHLRPSAASVAAATRPAQAAWIVFPQYQAGAPLSVQPHPKGDALIALASNSFNQHVHGRQGFLAMADMVQSCGVFDLRYSQLDDALAWFDGLLGPRT